MIALDSIIVRNGSLPSTVVDNDIVVLNLATNNYVGLDETGRVIWDLLESPRAVGQLCQILTERYAGAAEAIEADVLTFLDELSREGLIRVEQG